MTAKLETLDGVLEPFRPGFDADGFDVSVQGFRRRQDRGARPSQARRRLISDDMLGPMLRTAFRDVAPEVSEVRIEHVRGA